jgi:hypothetical protein
MTYTTPELCLIGSAQNLVLDDVASERKDCGFDGGSLPGSTIEELW